MQSDKLGPALSTILDELAQLGDGKALPGRLQQTKWNAARMTHNSQLGLDQMLVALMQHGRTGEPFEALASYPERLAVVAPADLARLFAPCAGHEVIAIAGPAAALSPVLADLGLEVTTLPSPAASTP